ncbi:MAG: hypothetical protein RLZZ611_2475 [Cyanobacteriota bacterium]|jgi:hypothetical protein
MVTPLRSRLDDTVSRRSGRRRIPWQVVLLCVLALADLRVEIQLLLDHFTWTSFSLIPVQHPLAVLVLMLTPSLWRRYRAESRAE